MYKIARQRHRARIGEHAHNLLVEYRRIAQFALVGQIDQLFIGDRIPEEERKVGSEFEIADRVSLARPQSCRNMLTPIQEKWTRQQTSDGASDTTFESAIFFAVLVIHEKLVYVLVGNRPPIRAF